MLARLKSAWDYSRIIFINALAGLSMIAGDLIGVLLGFDWGTVIGSKYVGFVMLSLNVANILLRFNTHCSVGEKRDCQ